MTPFFDNGVVQLYQTDARNLPLPDQSVHCCVCSPPYFGLRVYQDNDDRGIGLEASVEAYVANLVDVFREVRRVLRDDGVLWVNLGDSYANDPGWERGGGSTLEGGKKTLTAGNHLHGHVGVSQGNRLGIPERVVMALQEDGWVWRDTVIWAKKSAMPESVNGWRWERCRVKVRPGKIPRFGDPGITGFRSYSDIAPSDYSRLEALAEWSDCPGCPKCEPDGLVLRRGSWRCTSSHEYIYMLVKSMGYYCDAEAVKTKLAPDSFARDQRGYNGTMYARTRQGNVGDARTTGVNGGSMDPSGANRRSVWNDIRPEPYGGTSCPQCGETFKSKTYRRFPNLYTCQDCEYVIILSPNRSLKECPDCGGNLRHERLCIRCEVPLQSHYATFPSDLPRICIQASTSERGVCPVCGSQWARVVETTRSHESGSGKSGVAPTGKNGQLQGGGETGDVRNGPTVNTQTLGWRATCSCDAGSPVPALVLDPFAGTVTTCLAAQKLGRRAVGVDISEAYLKQAVKRLSGVPLPLLPEAGC